MWECTYFHRELRPGVREMLAGLKARGYRIGVISNNASLYNVFNVLEGYGIREYMEDVEVSSITGYRKPHPEIFRISMKQMQEKPENCVYVGDTLSRDVIGSKEFGLERQCISNRFSRPRRMWELSLPSNRMSQFKIWTNWFPGWIA